MPTQKKGKKTAQSQPIPTSSQNPSIDLRRECETLKEQLAQQSKFTTFLRHQIAEKDKTIATLEQNIIQLKEIHQRDLLLVESQVISNDKSKDHVISNLESEVSYLKERLDSVSSLEEDYLNCQEIITRLESQLFSMNQKANAQIQALESEVAQVKFMLGEDYRDKLQEIESSRHAELIKLVGPVTKATLESNVKLREKLRQEEIEAKQVILKLEATREKSLEMKRYSELLEDATTAQLTDVAQIKRRNDVLSLENKRLEQQIVDLQAAINTLHKEHSDKSVRGRTPARSDSELRAVIKQQQQDIERLQYELINATKNNVVQPKQYSVESLQHLWRARTGEEVTVTEPVESLSVTAEMVSTPPPKSAGGLRRRLRTAPPIQTSKSQPILQPLVVGLVKK
ncbi:hypothetical protein RCL1_008393 [Eukaryota sp. TZLM3-RCL]